MVSNLGSSSSATNTNTPISSHRMASMNGSTMSLATIIGTQPNTTASTSHGLHGARGVNRHEEPVDRRAPGPGCSRADRAGEGGLVHKGLRGEHVGQAPVALLHQLRVVFAQEALDLGCV
jgi:hypothetical protein